MRRRDERSRCLHGTPYFLLVDLATIYILTTPVSPQQVDWITQLGVLYRRYRESLTTAFGG